MKQSLALRSTTWLLAGAALALALGACNKPSVQTAQNAAVGGDDSATLISDTSEQGYAPAKTFSRRPPPPLPTYRQPPMPGYGYIWTPGYWAWDDGDGDYYWAPGAWVRPPRVGLLWTPGYWRYIDGQYGFSDGYWGEAVGFYGGVDYGYGYDGRGYEGGRWQGQDFYYNQSVNNFGGSNIPYTYRQDVQRGSNMVSFNGGAGGVEARPGLGELSAGRAPHVAPTSAQVQHVQSAMAIPGLRASVNQGRPAIAATVRPGVFSGPGVVTQARVSQPYQPAIQAARPAERPSPPAPMASRQETRQYEPNRAEPRPVDVMRPSRPEPAMRPVREAPVREAPVREAPVREAPVREVQAGRPPAEAMRPAEAGRPAPQGRPEAAHPPEEHRPQ